MINNKKTYPKGGTSDPKWVHDKNKINATKHDETLIFVGEFGVDSVKDGKLPNGDEYLWKKRRK
jgi:hypothetical protein